MLMKACHRLKEHKIDLQGDNLVYIHCLHYILQDAAIADVNTKT